MLFDIISHKALSYHGFKVNMLYDLDLDFKEQKHECLYKARCDTNTGLVNIPFCTRGFSVRCDTSFIY